MKYLARWRGGVYIRWQAVASIWSDGVVRWHSSTSWWFNWCVTSAWSIYMFPTSNTSSRKYYLWKKIIGWKIDLFFITENFLRILDRLCVERMCRRHDFSQFDTGCYWVNIRSPLFSSAVSMSVGLCFVCFSS